MFSLGLGLESAILGSVLGLGGVDTVQKMHEFYLSKSKFTKKWASIDWDI